MPEKAPRIVKPEPLVVQVFSVTPSRADRDTRVTDSHLRCLNACGIHANPWGAHWPSVGRLAAVVNRGRTWAFAKLRDLERWGYLRRLEWDDYPWIARHVGSGRQCVLRQLLWTRDWPKPPRKYELKAPLDPDVTHGHAVDVRTADLLTERKRRHGTALEGTRKADHA